MKTVRSITVSIILLMLCIVSYGQYIPVTNTIRTPYGNVNQTYYVGGPMHMYYGNAGAISYKHEFYVLLKNDSSFTVKTRIDISGKKHNLNYKKKGIEYFIHPDSTKSLSRTTIEGKQLLGIPADSCWLFKVGSGRINSYSFLAEESMQYVIAIQHGDDSPIVPLTKDNITAIVGESDPKINKLIERKKFIKVIEEFNKPAKVETKKSAVPKGN